MNLSRLKNKVGTENSNLITNITGAFIIKGCALLINLFTIPGYMSYFNNHQILGVWFTILSILTWILSFDLGIGNGLRNHLVGAFVENDSRKIKQLISSGYVICIFFTIFITLVGSIFIFFLDWNMILNIAVSAIGHQTLLLVVWFSFLSVMIQFVLKLILSILNAMQKTALSNLVVLFSNMIILLFILNYNSSNDEKNLIYLSIVYIVAVNLPLLLTTIILFTKKLKYAIPNTKDYVHKYAKDILSLGGHFFGVQITFMLIITTNEILISWLFAPENVVDYQVYFKLFYTFVTLYSLISNPVWSAVTKAYKEKNYKWIKEVRKWLNIASLVASIFTFAVVIILQPILDIWLGDNSIKVDYRIALIFALFSSLMIYIFSITTLANGIGKLRPQVIGYTFALVLKIPVFYAISHSYGDWVSIIITNILILIPFSIYQTININRLFRTLYPS